MHLRIKAHGKINPLLVVGKLGADGYHEIDTVFQAIDLHDTLTISEADTTTVNCTEPSLSGESNIVWKAMRLCMEVVELPPMRIEIEKHIPTQAGLGGGSSDAAASLRLFDKITRGALSPHLTPIALACGSDVPFFLGMAARAKGSGRGEILEPLEPLPEQSLVIVMPEDVTCSTSDAYARLDAMPRQPNVRLDHMPYNDFERVAPCESLNLIDRLRSWGIENAGLCGSGSAVYGFSDESEQVAGRLRQEGLWAVPTKTITSFGDPWTP